MTSRRVLSIAAAVLVGAAGLGLAPTTASASARYVTTQIGVRYRGDGSVPKTALPAIWVASADRKHCMLASVVSVQTSGDYIYVQDGCADGQSALGQVQFWYRGDSYVRRCRNNLGVDTVVRCNFDWPEGPTKVAQAASKHYPDGPVTYGLASPFSE